MCPNKNLEYTILSAVTNEVTAELTNLRYGSIPTFREIKQLSKLYKAYKVKPNYKADLDLVREFNEQSDDKLFSIIKEETGLVIKAVDTLNELDLDLLNETGFDDKTGIERRKEFIASYIELLTGRNNYNNRIPTTFAAEYLLMYKDTEIVKRGIEQWGSLSNLINAVQEEKLLGKGKALGFWKRFVEYINNIFDRISKADKYELAKALANALVDNVNLTEFDAQLLKVKEETERVLREQESRLEQEKAEEQNKSEQEQQIPEQKIQTTEAVSEETNLYLLKDINEIKRELIGLDFGQKVNKLVEIGLLAAFNKDGNMTDNPNDIYLGWTNNRPIVFLNFGNQLIPFYRSSEGTSGKEVGRWYNFFGFGEEGWLIKGTPDKIISYYGNPYWQKIGDLLTEELNYDHSLDLKKGSLKDFHPLFQNGEKSFSDLQINALMYGKQEYLPVSDTKLFDYYGFMVNSQEKWDDFLEPYKTIEDTALEELEGTLESEVQTDTTPEPNVEKNIGELEGNAVELNESELIQRFGKDVLRDAMFDTMTSDRDYYNNFKPTGQEERGNFEEYEEISPAFESEEDYEDYKDDFNKRKLEYEKYLKSIETTLKSKTVTQKSVSIDTVIQRLSQINSIAELRDYSAEFKGNIPFKDLFTKKKEEILSKKVKVVEPINDTNEPVVEPVNPVDALFSEIEERVESTIKRNNVQVNVKSKDAYTQKDGQRFMSEIDKKLEEGQITKDERDTIFFLVEDYNTDNENAAKYIRPLELRERLNEELSKLKKTDIEENIVLKEKEIEQEIVRKRKPKKAKTELNKKELNELPQLHFAKGFGGYNNHRNPFSDMFIESSVELDKLFTPDKPLMYVLTIYNFDAGTYGHHYTQNGRFSHSGKYLVDKEKGVVLEIKYDEIGNKNIKRVISPKQLGLWEHKEKMSTKIVDFDFENYDEAVDLNQSKIDSVEQARQKLLENKPKAESKKEIVLNTDQEQALEEIIDFYEDDNKKTHSLIGYAGTGKTTLINVFKGRFKKESSGWIFTSPTHRANAVMKSKGIGAITLHQLLGLQADLELKDYDEKKLRFVIKDWEKKKLSMPKNTLVIIDESSMIPDLIYDMIITLSEEFNLKLLFVGDDGQLKPPGQKHKSKALTSTEKQSVLTKVERANNNSLLKESMKVRGEGEFSYTSDIKNNQGIKFMNDEKEFLDKAIEMYKSDEFVKNPLLLRVVSGLNETVALYNEKIRTALKGDNAPQYVKDDIIMAYKSWKTDFQAKTSKMNNGGDYIILSSEPVTKKLGITGDEKNTFEFNGYKVVIQDLLNPEEESFEAFILDQNTPKDKLTKLGQIHEILRLKAVNSVGNEKREGFIDLQIFKDSFISPVNIVYNNKTIIAKTIDYGYAHTIHKSQGGTYKYVFVDSKGIKKFQDNEQKQELRYVAVTRAESAAYIYTEGAISDVKDRQEKIEKNLNKIDKVFNNIKEELAKITINPLDTQLRDSNNWIALPQQEVNKIVFNLNWKDEFGLNDEVIEKIKSVKMFKLKDLKVNPDELSRLEMVNGFAYQRNLVFKGEPKLDVIGHELLHLLIDIEKGLSDVRNGIVSRDSEFIYDVLDWYNLYNIKAVSKKGQPIVLRAILNNKDTYNFRNRLNLTNTTTLDKEWLLSKDDAVLFEFINEIVANVSNEKVVNELRKIKVDKNDSLLGLFVRLLNKFLATFSGTPDLYVIYKEMIGRYLNSGVDEKILYSLLKEGDSDRIVEELNRIVNEDYEGDRIKAITEVFSNLEETDKSLYEEYNVGDKKGVFNQIFTGFITNAINVGLDDNTNQSENIRLLRDFNDTYRLNTLDQVLKKFKGSLLSLGELSLRGETFEGFVSQRVNDLISLQINVGNIDQVKKYIQEAVSIKMNNKQVYNELVRQLESKLRTLESDVLTSVLTGLEVADRSDEGINNMLISVSISRLNGSRFFQINQRFNDEYTEEELTDVYIIKSEDGNDVVIKGTKGNELRIEKAKLYDYVGRTYEKVKTTGYKLPLYQSNEELFLQIHTEAVDISGDEIKDDFTLLTEDKRREKLSKVLTDAITKGNYTLEFKVGALVSKPISDKIREALSKKNLDITKELEVDFRELDILNRAGVIVLNSEQTQQLRDSKPIVIKSMWFDNEVGIDLKVGTINPVTYSKAFLFDMPSSYLMLKYENGKVTITPNKHIGSFKADLDSGKISLDEINDMFSISKDRINIDDFNKLAAKFNKLEMLHKRLNQRRKEKEVSVLKLSQEEMNDLGFTLTPILTTGNLDFSLGNEAYTPVSQSVIEEFKTIRYEGNVKDILGDGNIMLYTKQKVIPVFQDSVKVLTEEQKAVLTRQANPKFLNQDHIPVGGMAVAFFMLSVGGKDKTSKENVEIHNAFKKELAKSILHLKKVTFSEGEKGNNERKNVINKIFQGYRYVEIDNKMQLLPKTLGIEVPIPELGGLTKKGVSVNLEWSLSEDLVLYPILSIEKGNLRFSSPLDYSKGIDLKTAIDFGTNKLLIAIADAFTETVEKLGVEISMGTLNKNIDKGLGLKDNKEVGKGTNNDEEATLIQITRVVGISLGDLFENMKGKDVFASAFKYTLNHSVKAEELTGKIAIKYKENLFKNRRALFRLDIGNENSDVEEVLKLPVNVEPTTVKEEIEDAEILPIEDVSSLAEYSVELLETRVEELRNVYNIDKKKNLILDIMAILAETSEQLDRKKRVELEDVIDLTLVKLSGKLDSEIKTALKDKESFRSKFKIPKKEAKAKELNEAIDRMFLEIIALTGCK